MTVAIAIQAIFQMTDERQKTLQVQIATNNNAEDKTCSVNSGEGLTSALHATGQHSMSTGALASFGGH